MHSPKLITVVLKRDVMAILQLSLYVTGFWKITHMGANDTVNI